jgi:DNA-binding transcriptional LysR family regulator
VQIETLKIFCDLVETRSFSQAAERNFVTQSAVSQQVRGLESRFKRRLLERVRGRRELHLTQAGEAFFEASREVLSAYGRLEESMRQLSGTVGGTVRVATVYSVGLHELPPVVREFMALYPRAKIDLEYSRTTRVVRDVMSGAVDVGVVAYPEKRRGLDVVPLGGDRLVLICRPEHPLAGRKKLKAADLQGQNFIHFERDIPTRRATDRIFRAHGVTVHRVAEFDNIETIKRAVEVGMGVAVVPRPSVLDERRSGQLAVVPLAEPEWERAVGAVYRSDRALSTAARKFVELLQRRDASGAEVEAAPAPGDEPAAGGGGKRRAKKAGGAGR